MLLKGPAGKKPEPAKPPHYKDLFDYSPLNFPQHVNFSAVQQEIEKEIREDLAREKTSPKAKAFPQQQFHQVIHAVIVAHFKTLSKTQQLDILQAIFLQSSKQSTKESKHAFFVYISKLLQKSNVEALDKKLNEAFPGSDNDTDCLARLHFANTVIKMVLEVNDPLFTALQEATFASFPFIKDYFNLKKESFPRKANFKALSEQIQQKIQSCSADVEAITVALNDHRLTELAQNKESSMDKEERRRVLTVYEKLQSVYGQTFKAKGGTDKVLEELREYLTQECKREKGIIFPENSALYKAFHKQPGVEKKKGARKLLDSMIALLADECQRKICLTNAEREAFLQTFKIKNGNELNRKGISDAMLKSLIDFVAREYAKFNVKEPVEVQRAKSALRSLLIPAPESRHGSHYHNDEKRVYTDKGGSVILREILAFFWLAASDPNMPLEPYYEATRSQCISDEKFHILSYLAELRRAHNHDLRGREDEIDEPSCNDGFGRIGMHVHNRHTFFQVIASPAKELPLKIQAFFFRYFKALPKPQQVAIMKAINLRIIGEDTAESENIFFGFIVELLQYSTLERLIKNLEREYENEWNANLTDIAILEIINFASKMIFSINADLQESLEKTALRSLLEHCQAETEAGLAEHPDLADYAKNKFPALLLEMVSVRAGLTSLNQRPVNTLEEWQSSLNAAQELHQKHYALLENKEQIEDIIQHVAERQCQEKWVEKAREYFQSCPSKKFVITAEQSKFSFAPFWLKKYAANFLQSEGLCKFAYVDLMRQLKTTRQRLILKQFIESSNFLALDVHLSELTRQRSFILEGTQPDKIMQHLLALEEQKNRLVKSYTEQVQRFCATLKLTPQDEGFLIAISSDPNFLEQSLVQNQSEKGKILQQISQELQRTNCLLAQRHLIPLATQTNTVAVSSTKSDSKGLKKTLGSLLGSGKSLPPPQSDVLESAPQKLIISQYQKHFSDLQRVAQPKISKLTPQQVSNAEFFMNDAKERIHNGIMPRGCIVEPGTIIKIKDASCDPAIVSFIRFVEGKEVVKEVSISIATLEGYVASFRNKENALADEADVLLRSFEKEISPKGYEILFFNSLYKAYTDDKALFAGVLERQTTCDIQLMVEKIAKLPKQCSYHKFVPELKQAIEAHQKRYAESGQGAPLVTWEEAQVPLLNARVTNLLQAKIYTLRR